MQDHSAKLVPDDSNPSQSDATTETTIEESAELDDFYQMGKYMYIVCAFAELMFFILVFLWIFTILLKILCLTPQMANMLFMTYAGAVPKLVSCGNLTLDKDKNQTDQEKCDSLEELLGNKTKLEFRYCLI